MARVDSENPEGCWELRFLGKPLWEGAESWGGKKASMVLLRRK